LGQLLFGTAGKNELLSGFTLEHLSIFVEEARWFRSAALGKSLGIKLKRKPPVNDLALLKQRRRRIGCARNETDAQKRDCKQIAP
jgi:hypothetical protein